MSTAHKAGAISAVLLGAISLAWTTCWLGLHAWRWSNGAAAVAVFLAVPALFLVCLSFRDPSARRSITTALSILAITAVLYIIFPRDTAAF
jgi:hypothetical protein